MANNPVLSTSSCECQRSGEQSDPLQTSDPWLSFCSGPGSQQALKDALWGTYGPTTTQLAAMPRTLNLPQSCSHVGQPGGVLTGGGGAAVLPTTSLRVLRILVVVTIVSFTSKGHRFVCDHFHHACRNLRREVAFNHWTYHSLA